MTAANPAATDTRMTGRQSLEEETIHFPGDYALCLLRGKRRVCEKGRNLMVGRCIAGRLSGHCFADTFSTRVQTLNKGRQTHLWSAAIYFNYLSHVDA